MTKCVSVQKESGQKPPLQIELTLVEHKSNLPGMYARHLDDCAGELPWAYGWIANLHAHPQLGRAETKFWARIGPIFALQSLISESLACEWLPLCELTHSGPQWLAARERCGSTRGTRPCLS